MLQLGDAVLPFLRILRGGLSSMLMKLESKKFAGFLLTSTASPSQSTYQYIKTMIPLLLEGHQSRRFQRLIHNTTKKDWTRGVYLFKNEY
jgi:hypothetical protein